MNMSRFTLFLPKLLARTRRAIALLVTGAEEEATSTFLRKTHSAAVKLLDTGLRALVLAEES
jgi:hypothetical protein